MDENLSDDERTVLMLAAEGASMLAIGRWEKPIEHLVELGLLEQHDKFNNVITSAGRKAIDEANEAVDNEAAQALIKGCNAKLVYRKSGELLAQNLVDMAKAAAEATGDEPLIALQKCVGALRDRAIELLDNE